MILKKDIPIVNEFLGTTNVSSFITPFKCLRTYMKLSCQNASDVILILTPTLQEDGYALNRFLIGFKLCGKQWKAIEHKRGKNYVYTFEET